MVYKARRSALDWFFEGASVAALLASTWDLQNHWEALPARIATHFDARGHPNGFGGKDSLLFLYGITIAVAVGLTIAERYQRLINIPLRVDRESPAVRRLLRSMAIVLKAVILITFGWIAHVTMKTALGEASGLGRAFLPLFIGGTLAPVVYYIVKLKRL